MAYEWKRLYKFLLRLNNEGICTRAQFEACCQKVNVTNISRDELAHVSNLYPAKDNGIDFIAMSKDLGLHGESLRLKSSSI